MKKTLRILAWIAGVLAAVIVLAMVGLWLFFPVEKAKNLAIEKGSAQLGSAHCGGRGGDIVLGRGRR